MSKLKINPEDFLKDLDEVLKTVSKIDNLDPETTDINILSKNLKKINKKLKNKYKDLDSKK